MDRLPTLIAIALALAACDSKTDNPVEPAARTNGAKVNTANRDGSRPLDVATLDDGTTRYFASVLKLELNEDGLTRRKAAVIVSRWRR